MQQFSRKSFLKVLGYVLILPFALLWNSVLNNTPSKKSKTVVPPELPDGVSFFNNVIAVKSDEKVMFFSSRCSHLGCRINKSDGNKIVCPCHGSEYNLKGEVIKGPAGKPLSKLLFSIDKKTGGYLVDDFS